VKLVDRLTAGVDKEKRQQGVQHARQSSHHHAPAETGRAHQVLAVALVYGFGVLGE
jgi:hypothetical protein